MFRLGPLFVRAWRGAISDFVGRPGNCWSLESRGILRTSDHIPAYRAVRRSGQALRKSYCGPPRRAPGVDGPDLAENQFGFRQGLSTQVWCVLMTGDASCRTRVVLAMAMMMTLMPFPGFLYFSPDCIGVALWYHRMVDPETRIMVGLGRSSYRHRSNDEVGTPGSSSPRQPHFIKLDRGGSALKRVLPEANC